MQPDGSIKTVRKKHAVGLSRGDDKIAKKQAEGERDKFLTKQNAPTVEAAVEQVAATGVALFGEVAKMYAEGYLGREMQDGQTDSGEGAVLSGQVHCSQVGRPASEPDPSASDRGLAAHNVRLLVDHARRARNHEPHLLLCGGPWALGGRKTKSCQ